MKRYEKPETVIVELQQRGMLMSISNIDSDVFEPEIGPGDGDARTREFEWEDFQLRVQSQLRAAPGSLEQ